MWFFGYWSVGFGVWFGSLGEEGFCWFGLLFFLGFLIDFFIVCFLFEWGFF